MTTKQRDRPNWFGRLLLRTAGIPVKAAISMSDEAYWSTWSPQGSAVAPGLADISRAVGDGSGLDVIMTPVLWIARRMAESPIGVLAGDDPVLDMEHDVATLLRWPNGWYAGSTMRLAMAINYLMDGNAYLRRVRDTRGKVAILMFYPTWTMEPITPSGMGYVDEYQFTPGGATPASHIPAKDVVHIRFGIDPNNTRKGISPLKILLRELYTDMEGAAMTAILMKNAGLMGAVISPKSGSVINPAKPTETKKYIEDNFEGTKRGKPLVMTTPTEISYFGADAAKMDLSRLREIPEERVCALLNVPAAIVGFGTGMQQTKVGATIIELRAMAYEDCIIPTQNAWCDELDLQLMPEFEENPRAFHCQFDNSRVRVLQEDDNAISTKLVQQLVNGGITLAEFRESIGRETDDSQQVYYVPGTVFVTPAKDINAPVQPAPAAAAATTTASSEPKQGVHNRTRVTPKISRLVQKLRRQERAARGAWQPKLAEAFRVYAEQVAERFNAVAIRREAKILAGNGQKAAEPDWEAIVGEAVTISWANRDIAPLIASYGEQFLAVARMTFEAVNTELSLGVMLSDGVQQAVYRAGGRRLGLIDLEQETRDAMFEVIAQAREEGLGADAMAALIREQVGAGPWGTSDIRAQVIARTETKYAQNYASLEAYRASDTITDVMIFDGQLPTSCEECIALNGTVVSLEEALALMESEHPNGTRSFCPVVT